MIRSWRLCSRLLVLPAVLVGCGLSWCTAADSRHFVTDVRVAAEPMKGLLHNEDCTNFFYCRQIAAGKAGEAIDHYVDVMAQSGVTVFLCNTNARRTNYRSRVWDSFWDGYDPAGPDAQPFLAPIPRNDVAAYRRLVRNMLVVHQEGIDYPARVIQRCRYDGISPWITLRMNDCHCNAIPTHPFHGSFWRENPPIMPQELPGLFCDLPGLCAPGGPRLL